MAKKVTKIATATSDVEVVAKPGMGIDEGIVLTTFFLMLLAIVLVYLANQTYATPVA
jgi:methylaspartate ammonia-lyase